MMHILKSQFLQLLFLVSSWSSGLAQSIDSVEVLGRVQWKDTRIMGYPDELKAISKTGKVYLSPIDSAGEYHFRLPVGSYTLTPSSQFLIWLRELTMINFYSLFVNIFRHILQPTDKIVRLHAP